MPRTTQALWLLLLVIIPPALIAASAAPPLDSAAQILEEVSGREVRSFSTRDFGRELFPDARSVLVPENEAETILAKVRGRIPPGTIAFIGTTRSLATPKADGVEIVVAPGSSQFDILRVAASDGINYDLMTEDLVRELTEWDAEMGIDIWQAETDTIQLRLKSLPKDPMKFAERVYKFCPDVVDQGTGSVKELARWIRKSKQVFLWWD